MARLNTEGHFQVRITDCFLKEPRFNYHSNPENLKNDPNAFCLVMKCETADGLEAYHEMDWTEKVITTGKYTGKKEKEVTTEKLAELGIPDGYPGNLKKMMQEGKTIEAQVNMVYRAYNDKATGEPKKILEAKYLNAPRKEVNIKDIDFEALLGGTATVTSVKSTVPTSQPTVEQINAELDAGSDDFAEEGEATPF